MSGGQWDYVQDKLMHICADIRMQMGRATYEDEVEQGSCPKTHTSAHLKIHTS